MIRELRQDEAGAYVELRRQALMDSPLAFASSPFDDFVSSTTIVREELRRAPEFVIIGAFDGDLIGTVGLYRARTLMGHVESTFRVASYHAVSSQIDSHWAHRIGLLYAAQDHRAYRYPNDRTP
jgi:hypothetical protein